MNDLFYFLKLGGSLITDKHRPHTARKSQLARLAREIEQARSLNPGLRLLIGHGSGSFGHVAAKQFNTRAGVHNPEQWFGFDQVWSQARALNELVIEALEKAHLPVMAFPPSASVFASDGQVSSWDYAPLQAALQAGLIPVINGDVVFDNVRGGTILSTEELFAFLTPHLKPSRILLAGLENGVWMDFPLRTQLIESITPATFDSLLTSITGSAAVDVTGGMYEKVASMLRLIKIDPLLDVLIFSGLEPGALFRALSGEIAGTLIHNHLLGGNK